MRGIKRGLDNLANPSAVRIGEWVLSVDSSGELIATKPGRLVELTRQLAATNAAGKTVGLHRTYLVTIVGSPTGGAFQLKFAGTPTTPLDPDATADEVRDALVALSSRYSTLDFTVTGANGGPWTIVAPDFGTISAISALTGGSLPSITVE